MTRATWLTVCAGAWLVVGAGGCNNRPPLDRDGAAGTGTARAGAGGATGGAQARRRRSAGTGGGAGGTGGASTRRRRPRAGGTAAGVVPAGTGGPWAFPRRVVTCTPAGGRYCGTIGTGCPGGRLECGACPASDVCTSGICVGGASCMPLTCNGTVRYCGRIGDGCGRALLCSPCPDGQSCQGGFCFSPPAPRSPATSRPAAGTAARSATAAAARWTAGLAAAARSAAATFRACAACRRRSTR